MCCHLCSSLVRLGGTCGYALAPIDAHFYQRRRLLGGGGRGGGASESFAILAAEAESPPPSGQSAPRKACRADCKGPPAQGYVARGRGDLRIARPGRPIYRNPARPPAPVARRLCARTLRREEYITLSAHFRAPISGRSHRISQMRKLPLLRLMCISA